MSTLYGSVSSMGLYWISFLISLVNTSSLPAISSHAHKMTGMMASVSCWLLICPSHIRQRLTLSLTFYLHLNLNSHNAACSFIKEYTIISSFIVVLKSYLFIDGLFLKKVAYCIFLYFEGRDVVQIRFTEAELFWLFCATWFFIWHFTKMFI